MIANPNPQFAIRNPIGNWWSDAFPLVPYEKGPPGETELSTLCNLTLRTGSDHREPNWLAAAVVTWTALRPRPAMQFGSQSGRGTERRKAMVTRQLQR